MLLESLHISLKIVITDTKCSRIVCELKACRGKTVLKYDTVGPRSRQYSRGSSVPNEFPAWRLTSAPKTKKLNVHLFDALRKGLYKPAAFIKGILFP
jgi:hypothetical protein